MAQSPDQSPDPALGGNPAAFADSLAALRQHLAELEAQGEDAPPEAREIMKRLEELTSALAGLRESFDPPKPGDP